MAAPKISIAPHSLHPELAELIEGNLLKSLAELNQQSENSSIVISANCDSSGLIGGVTGSTSYGWLLVKTLWVSSEVRGTGIGRNLMSVIEEQAVMKGCHSAWLDTSSATARAFYQRLGYAEFGVLSNGMGKEPVDHNRWFMKKTLLAGNAGLVASSEEPEP